MAADLGGGAEVSPDEPQQQQQQHVPVNISLSNGSEPWQPEQARDHLLIIMPLSVVYVTILVFGVLGNISTCIVIGRNRQMRTATNYYLFSLACSDLLLLISGLPLELHKTWFPYPYPFNEAVCVIQGLAAETSANATVLTILLFTFERYMAICHPLAKHQARRRCRHLHRVCKAPCLLAGVWIVSLCLAVPQAMQFGILGGPASPGAPDLSECTLKGELMAHAFLLSSVLFFIGPLCLITVLYVLIAVKLYQAKQAGLRSTAQQTQGHVFRILVAVVVTFFLCWFPFHAQRLIAVYAAPSDPADEAAFKALFNAVTYVSGVLYFMSTMINPILYHSMSNKFKEAFWDTIYRDFNGFNCITIPEHWKRKQESRYNMRRGNDWSRRNGGRTSARSQPSTHGPHGPQHAAAEALEQGDLFQMVPLKPKADGPTAAADGPGRPLRPQRGCLTAVVDVNRLHAGLLCRNGGANISGVSLLSLPPLLRSQSLYSPPRVPLGALQALQRRCCTLELIDDTLLLRAWKRDVLDDGVPGGGPGGHGGDAACLRVRVRRAAMPTDVDAIRPYPATPTPPTTAPSSPDGGGGGGGGGSPPDDSPPSSTGTVIHVPPPPPAPPPPPPPPPPPRVVEMHLKKEPGWV